MIKTILSFLMVFILSQSDIFLECYVILKFILYKKSKKIVLYPKYVAMLYNFGKYSSKIV